MQSLAQILMLVALAAAAYALAGLILSKWHKHLQSSTPAELTEKTEDEEDDH